MITSVEALHYRCLHYVAQPLKPFHVLVGPNASGKTTFLDVVGFLGDIVSNGLDKALAERTPDPRDLLFGGCGTGFQLAVEAETLLLRKTGICVAKQRDFFPQSLTPPSSLQANIRSRDCKVLVNKVPGGNDNFYDETKPPGRRWAPSFRLGPRKSALGNLPADEASFPIATWFREYLGSGIQRFMLNSRAIRYPSPPTRVSGFLPDGSNLSWVVARLRENAPKRHAQWIAHLRTALPDLTDIRTIKRPEDRHCYMTYEYSGGLTVPSWLVSDGTLRLTALTLPAYLTDLHGLYLIEEPENGIHPGAIATVYDSLRSMYTAQVLLATHSPVVLSVARRDDVLCFAKNDNGATDIVLGSEHPQLREWLVDKGWVHPPDLKPGRPKEAFDSALREAGVPRSSSLYQQIAERVSLRGCEDRSFQRLCSILREWFPAEPGSAR